MMTGKKVVKDRKVSDFLKTPTICLALPIALLVGIGVWVFSGNVTEAVKVGGIVLASIFSLSVMGAFLPF